LKPADNKIAVSIINKTISKSLEGRKEMAENPDSFHSMSHKIIEWLGLEGTPRIIKFQHPCHRQGCQPPHLVSDQASQGLIQPGLKHLQEWNSHSGQPVPGSHYSLCEEFFSVSLELSSSVRQK